ncbi:DNA polymerase III subunit chi [Ameyamaea chiangmaiensis NBRC 103196]|uniref:DNA polymerase III subunit chi n=1 Tax=Ameyamaea chiangmaiensis TaxID=442969 RepID=A0A850PHZ7_9PROT|nr:DNA polymerase III subunit chi [Ameyamaea chiangmaiensis]MBS4074644.1 DNA polymerase III subunit chi [Ameyamaea chiangmaiensis]NVN41866.1 DNA polymerase III subunit chi [Ameyamaea chiangmaiensis]GBQ64967.1 DNA polymerase III subunit chi [Ameyamaea chiangmaiensis NBRC 103196]
MAEVGFYHLTRTSLEEALAPLLGRTLEAGKRAVVRCADDAAVGALDASLWKVREPVWLPHGSAALGQAAWQPVWLTADDDTPNGATFLFSVAGATIASPERFERIFDLFDGGDAAAVAAARVRWSAMKASGHTLTYWRQETRGWRRAG